MLYVIRVYYDTRTKTEYENFLFNYLVRGYLENGDFMLTKNINSYNYRYLKLMDDKNKEIEITCKPFMETAIQGFTADKVYIQNTALWKTNSDILDLIPEMFRNKPIEAYVFDKDEVIGQWNIN